MELLPLQLSNHQFHYQLIDDNDGDEKRIWCF
ncbi:unnamed protein product, partial [Rotaria sp. Silwood1]